MKRLPLILSCVAFLLSAFALHVAWRTKQDVQALAHSLPPYVIEPLPSLR